VNRVKAAFFSLTPPPGAAEDISGYLRWHLLDHMPEQYQLPGIVYATRWIADADCADARIAGDGRLQRVGSIMNYLVGDPVQRTHDDFMELGPRLADLGRYPEALASLQLRMLALLRWYAAPRVLVSAEVVPFRPHRGIVALVEEPGDGDVARWLTWLHAEHYPALLDAPGVAGAWMYGSTSTWQLHPRCQGAPQYITVIYLDGEPLVTAREIAAVIERRWSSGAVHPQFAGPLRSMVQWDAWPVQP